MTFMSGDPGCFDGSSTTAMSFCLTSIGEGICSLGGIALSLSSSESEEDELDEAEREAMREWERRRDEAEEDAQRRAATAKEHAPPPDEATSQE